MDGEQQLTIRAEAIAWHIRLRDGSAEDWEMFTAWASKDPRHGQAYDEIAIADQDLEESLAGWSQSIDSRANDNLPASQQGSRGWVFAAGVGAIAAASVFMVAPNWRSQPDLYEVSTKAGERKTVTLGERDHIALNGDTRLRLSRGNNRFAALEKGEASFQIVHDPSAPFTLQVGGSQVVDVGTSFNVTKYNGGLVVQVAEGSIVYNPEREAVRLTAGQALRRNDRELQMRLSSLPPTDVGGWQKGRLSYRSASLPEIAEDLTRNLGIKVTVAPALAARSFTGTIQIERNDDKFFARLAKLLDVEARRSSAGWALHERMDATQ
ncbi:MAG TPA: FecR domain-containing protein [Sphingomicrobium sp.]|nr:FecR domain-containing protein [Sphingomicrobium sp.]